MNRIDFMAQLKRLLSDIPESDRNDAIAYYNDYFDEAGAENEAQVIQELGNPGKVAAMIRASLRNVEDSKGEYSETGYQEAGAEARRQTPAERYAGEQPRRRGRIALMIILAIFASPFIIGVGGGAIGVIIGLVSVLCGIIVLLFGMAITGLVAGIIGIVTGIIEMFVNPATGLLMVGSGMISLAVTLTLICLAVWLGVNIIPKLVRGIFNLISRVLHRGIRGGEVQ